MIWDCFPYWREQALVDTRRRLWERSGLDVEMVAFVGDRTHRGTAKAHPPPVGVRTVDVVLDAPTDWGRERQQRDAVLGLAAEMDPDDVVLVCDVDELVDPSAVERIAGDGVTGLEMWMYPFDREWRCRRPWTQAKAMRASYLRGLAGDVRGGWVMRRVRLAGWHLTSNDDEKLASFAHAECDTVSYRELVRRCRRDLVDMEGVPLVYDPLPSHVIEVL